MSPLRVGKGSLRPVVLVHGYLATPGLMRPLRTSLRGYGHDIHLAPELSCLVAGDVRAHAKELERTVQRVRRWTGAERVDVVGASQGGIVALWWAHTQGWGRIGRLVALGTPFRGSPLAGAAAPLVGLFSAGIRQMVPGSPFLEALGAVPLERPVVSVSMQGDRVVPPEAASLPGMEARVVQARWGPLSHQLMMVDPRASRAVHEALC